MNGSHQAALAALQAGLSTVPPRMDGSKAPIGTWKQYQSVTPSQNDIDGWYSNGQTGVGLVTGAVSGNLECLDFDTREAWGSYKEAAKSANLMHLLSRVANGYAEQSPNGFHLLYKCESIGGSKKLAQRLSDKKTLIETRGEGAFIIVAPSSGKVNSSGNYVLKAGGFESIATITEGERNQLLTLARTFDEMPKQKAAHHAPGNQAPGTRPGDEFNRTHTWPDVLVDWVQVFERNGVTRWRRPGKDDDISATTNHAGSNLLWVFSTSTQFEAERSYDLFGAYVLLKHGGDFKAATRALAGNQPPDDVPYFDYGMQGGEYNYDQQEDIFVWPEITPLDTALPPVEPFSYKLLPDGLIEWVRDIVERTQCPPDFVAVTVMVATASLIGRKVAIYPMQCNDWLVIPNLWGALIGRPSAMKTPAMTEGLRPLKRLALKSKASFHQAVDDYKLEIMEGEINEDLLKADLKSALKANNKVVELAPAKDAKKKLKKAREAIENARDDEPPSPVERRYIVNDVTVEKLGELLNQNPNGLLLERDELTGWLKSLDREDRATDRSFYLQAFNGGGVYTYDRIGRGTIHIESTTVSLIGGLQPSRLGPYVWHAINQGAGDDGLIQRFQLAVYPDDPGSWKNVDRWPNSDHKKAAFEIFQRLDELEAQPLDEEGRVTGVRFDESGQHLFNEWRTVLEHKTREPGIHPAIESHLVKYRSLMPSLALIINEVEAGHNLPVTERSAQKAAAWCQYLESHAMRIYGGAIDPAAQCAETILERRSKLPSQLKVRDIQQKRWSGLSDSKQVKRAIDELVDCGYLRASVTRTGGRPSISYTWNPAIENEK